MILASDIPANREVLGQEAVYFKELSINGIKQTVQQVLQWDNEKCGELGIKARQRVIDNFSWSRIGERYQQLFFRIF